MDVEEITCALVDASIGYHTADGAERHAEAFLRGETRCACERCLSGFGGDLRKAVAADLRYWSKLSEPRRESVRAFVRETRGMGTMERATASMRYPTALP